MPVLEAISISSIGKIIAAVWAISLEHRGRLYCSGCRFPRRRIFRYPEGATAVGGVRPNIDAAVGGSRGVRRLQDPDRAAEHWTGSNRRRRCVRS